MLNASRHQGEHDSDGTWSVPASPVLNASRHQGEHDRRGDEDGRRRGVEVLNASRHQGEHDRTKLLGLKDGSGKCSTPLGIRANTTR